MEAVQIWPSMSSHQLRRRSFAIAGLCVLCCAAMGCPTSKLSSTSQLSAATQQTRINQPIPFKVEEIFGQRPVVDISLNGRAYRAMIHANAGFYLQINHAQAEAVGVEDMEHQGSYGIEAAGKVSALGRDTGVVGRLAVGSVVDRDVQVSVFETPGPEHDRVCMLGLGWISAHALVMDFARNQVTAPTDPDAAKALRERLLGEGYVALPMTRGEGKDGRYLVTGTIGKASAPMVVSTVSTLTLDTEFARRAGVTQGKLIGEFGGPSGATGSVYESRDPVVLRIGDWHARPLKASIEDTYAYSKETRPADPIGGNIGADFLIAHGAVIDFGSKTLYVRR